MIYTFVYSWGFDLKKNIYLFLFFIIIGIICFSIFLILDKRNQTKDNIEVMDTSTIAICKSISENNT